MPSDDRKRDRKRSRDRSRDRDRDRKRDRKDDRRRDDRKDFFVFIIVVRGFRVGLGLGSFRARFLGSGFEGLLFGQGCRDMSS